MDTIYIYIYIYLYAYNFILVPAIQINFLELLVKTCPCSAMVVRPFQDNLSPLRLKKVK